MISKIGISFGLAFVLAIGVIGALLALGTFNSSTAVADTVSGKNNSGSPTASATPNEPGAASRIVIEFFTDEDLKIGDTITIEFEDEFQVPASLSAANISITATGSGTTTTFTQPPSDVTVRKVGYPATQHEIVLTVPDMNKALDTSSYIKANSNVKIIFDQNSGIFNPTGSATRTVKIITTAESAQASAQDARLGSAYGGIFFPRVISLSSSNGTRGSVITVTGKGFVGSTTATVWLDNDEDGVVDSTEIELGSATIGGDGTFTATVTVGNPPFVSGSGTKSGSTRNAINAKDGRGNTIVPTTDGTYDDSSNGLDTTSGNCLASGGSISCLSAWNLRGTISVVPATAAIGDSVQVTLKDFTASRTMSSGTYKIGGVSVTAPSGSLDSAGEKTFNITVPNGTPEGSQAFEILSMCCGTAATDPASTRRFTMTISGATLTLTPETNLVPNQTITVIGQGYTTGGSATINLASDSSLVTISGDATDLFNNSSSAQTKINEGNTITVDNGGNWSSSLIMPINATTTTGGSHELKVKDSSGRAGTLTFTIAERTLVLDPVSSRVGTTITVTGAGYPADNTKTGADATPSVAIKYTVSGTARTVATLTPDASGNLNGTFIVPLDAGIPSTNSVRAEYTFDSTTVTTATSHDVPRATLTIDAGEGPSGTIVTIVGSGFKTYSSLTELKIGDVDVRPAPIPSTNTEGGFTATVTVPQLNTGTQTVTGKVSSTTASTTFTVLATAVVATVISNDTETVFADDIASGNLISVFQFNNATKVWSFFNPDFIAAGANTYNTATGGDIVWIRLEANATFQGAALTAGWNLVSLD